MALFDSFIINFILLNGSFGTLIWLYVPLIIWIMLLVLLMVFLLRHYTFGNWTPEHPNPYEKETLGLPRGVMRGTLTLTLLVVVILLEIFTIRFEDLETRISEFIVAFQMMLSFYFGSKVMHHLTSVDERKNKASAKAVELTEKARLEEAKQQQSPAKPTKERDFEDEKAVG